MEILPGNYTITFGHNSVHFDRIIGEVEISRLRRELEDARRANKELRLVNESVEVEISRLRRELDAVQASSVDPAECNGLRSKLHATRAARDAAERVNADLTIQRDRFREKLAAATRVNAMHEQDKAKLRERVDSLVNRLTEIKTLVRGADEEPW